jgi:hypothetical protein
VRFDGHDDMAKIFISSERQPIIEPKIDHENYAVKTPTASTTATAVRPQNYASPGFW